MKYITNLNVPEPSTRTWQEWAYNLLILNVNFYIPIPVTSFINWTDALSLQNPSISIQPK